MLYNEHQSLTVVGKEIEKEADDFVGALIKKHSDIPIHELIHVVIVCATRSERQAVLAKSLERCAKHVATKATAR